VVLELLETSPCVLRFQVLRLLSDLLENNDMVVFVRAWRSPKTMRLELGLELELGLSFGLGLGLDSKLGLGLSLGLG
jgi:hypothetical protein